MDDKVKCAVCGSEQISANKRGWSLFTGFIGSGKTVITCLNCGHKWAPKLYKDEKSEANFMLIALVCLIIGAFATDSITNGIILTILVLLFRFAIKRNSEQ